MQKYVINRFFQWNSLIFLKFFSNDRIWVFVHCNGPKLPKWENTEKSRSDGAFMGKQFLYTEFSVENRLEHGFAIENTYFFWKWRFAHYFHYYSVLSVFRPHIVQNRKLTLFSWGNFDQTTRISAKVRYKQVFSMKLSYFLEIFLQRSYMSVCSLQWA